MEKKLQSTQQSTLLQSADKVQFTVATEIVVGTTKLSPHPESKIQQLINRNLQVVLSIAKHHQMHLVDILLISLTNYQSETEVHSLLFHPLTEGVQGGCEGSQGVVSRQASIPSCCIKNPFSMSVTRFLEDIPISDIQEVKEKSVKN